MWCKNNGCMYYNEELNKCTRKGKYGDNKDKESICWMAEEY